MARALLQLHASTVAIDDRAVFIFGPSGAGKSGLALQLMALGAQLVADDITQVAQEGEALIATCPTSIRNQIEARGVGILKVDALERARIVLAVDMGSNETDRLPAQRSFALLGQTVPLLHKVEISHFPAAIMQYMQSGRSA